MLNLQIITPTGIMLDEKVDMVIMRCITGDMGILPRHENHSAVLDYGAMRLFSGGEERKVAIFGGLAEIKNNLLTITTSDAQWPEDIDLKIAQANRKHALMRLEEKNSDLQIESDQILLRRSLVQIEVSSFPFISKDEENE